MHVLVFNVSLLVGWLLVLCGGVIVNLGLGLVAAGLLLVVLTIVSARMAGRLYSSSDFWRSGDREAS